MSGAVNRDPYPTITKAVQRAAKATWLVRMDDRDKDSWSKEDRTPVTVADLAAQAVILGEMMQAAPGETVFAEEDTSHFDDDAKASRVREIVEEVLERSVSLGEIREWISYRGKPNGSTRWFVDPLDGTKGFVKGLAYAVAVARSVDGALDCSWLAVPGREEVMPGTAGRVFRAVHGGGAFVRPLDGEGEEKRVRLSGGMPDGEIIVVGSRAHGSAGGPKELEEGGLKTRYLPFDSQAKYAAVAMNAAHLYVREPHPKFGPNLCWDHAPGALIVQEAGGVVTDLNGKPYDFTLGERMSANLGVLAASSAELHEKALSLLRLDRS